MPPPSFCSFLLTFYTTLCLNRPLCDFIFLCYEGWNPSLPIHPSVYPSLPPSLLSFLINKVLLKLFSECCISKAPTIPKGRIYIFYCDIPYAYQDYRCKLESEYMNDIRAKSCSVGTSHAWGYSKESGLSSNCC